MLIRFKIHFLSDVSKSDLNPRFNIEQTDSYSNINSFKINQVNEERFDSTGMFHWVEERDINTSVLDCNKKNSFAGHVIVCVYAEHHSPLVGLRNFIMPLRASNYYYEELKDIIFIGNREFLEKEWKSISNFPKVYILPVSYLILTIFFIKSK